MPLGFKRVVDDAVFVQFNKYGLYVAQYGVMTGPMPDPDEATVMFTTLDECVNHHKKEAKETENGYQLRLNVDDYAAKVDAEIADEYHTMEELYNYRMVYHAHSVLLWSLMGYPVFKSRKHHDGDDCFDGEFFIVTAQLPTGQVTNHYKLENWDLFYIPEVELAPEWDGHTPEVAYNRLYNYITGERFLDEERTDEQQDSVEVSVGDPMGTDVGPNSDSGPEEGSAA